MKMSVVAACAALVVGLSACGDSTGGQAPSGETTSAETTSQSADPSHDTSSTPSDTTDGTSEETAGQWGSETTFYKSSDDVFNLEMPSSWIEMPDSQRNNRVLARGDEGNSAAIIVSNMGPWNDIPSQDEIAQSVSTTTGQEVETSSISQVGEFDAFGFEIRYPEGIDVNLYYINIDGTCYEMTVNMAKGVTISDLEPYINSIEAR